MAAATLISGNFVDSCELAHTAIRHDPTNGTAHRFLAAALALDGQTEAAYAAWIRSREVQPLDSQEYITMLHRAFKRDEDTNRLIEALRLAGALFD